MRSWYFIPLGFVALLPGASSPPGLASLPGGSGPPGWPVASQPPAAPAPAHVPAGAPPRESPSGRLVLVAGGDVNLGRGVGQRLLREPAHDPLRGVRALLSDADVAFVNLESVLSDHSRETQHPQQPLVFKGTSEGARALARSGIDVVSLANNHLWDYAETGFRQTLALLGREGIGMAGASLDTEKRLTPAVLERNGVSLALFAVTATFNAGDLDVHEARAFVDRADLAALVPAITRAKARGHRVVVSYHGGTEYAEEPDVEVIGFARAVLRAGADAFLGHHPHVPQGVGWERGRPAFYSLGNLVFGAHRDHPWTTRGYLARLTFESEGPPRAEACPYVIERGEPRALLPEARAHQPLVRELSRRSSRARPRGVILAEPGGDGCVEITEPKDRSVGVR